MKLPVLLANRKLSNFRLFLYRFASKRDYYVIEHGNIRNTKEPLVRIHSACSFATVFNSQRCDCEAQLQLALRKISNSVAGLLIYAWAHEGRAVGMWNHVRVYMEQDKGEDTVSSYEVLGLPVDSRDYTDAISILKAYKISRVKLLTNNPKKVESLENSGIKVVRTPLIAKLTKYNQSQMKVKIKKLGHYFDEVTRNSI